MSCSVPFTWMPMVRSPATASATAVGSSASTAAAACGISFPNRGPSERVGLHLVPDQLRLLGDELDLLHAELAGDEPRQPLDLVALAIGGDDHRLAKRLADLDPGLGAGGPAELDRSAHRRHAELEVGVLEPLVGLGEVEQVD